MPSAHTPVSTFPVNPADPGLGQFCIPLKCRPRHTASEEMLSTTHGEGDVGRAEGASAFHSSRARSMKINNNVVWGDKKGCSEWTLQPAGPSSPLRCPGTPLCPCIVTIDDDHGTSQPKGSHRAAAFIKSWQRYWTAFYAFVLSSWIVLMVTFSLSPTCNENETPEVYWQINYF